MVFYRKRKANAEDSEEASKKKKPKIDEETKLLKVCKKFLTLCRNLNKNLKFLYSLTINKFSK